MENAQPVDFQERDGRQVAKEAPRVLNLLYGLVASHLLAPELPEWLYDIARSGHRQPRLLEARIPCISLSFRDIA